MTIDAERARHPPSPMLRDRGQTVRGGWDRSALVVVVVVRRSLQKHANRSCGLELEVTETQGCEEVEKEVLGESRAPTKGRAYGVAVSDQGNVRCPAHRPIATTSSTCAGCSPLTSGTTTPIARTGHETGDRPNRYRRLRPT